MEYIYLTSSQSRDVYSGNVWYDFNVDLPKELYFPNGCECALVSFDTYPSMDMDCNLFCDILEQSCFENLLLPFLACVKTPPQYFEQLHFKKTICPRIASLRLYIRKAYTNEPPSESIQFTQVVLLLRECTV